MVNFEGHCIMKHFTAYLACKRAQIEYACPFLFLSVKSLSLLLNLKIIIV